MRKSLSREAARKAGQKRYLSNTICGNGHNPPWRYVSSKACCECTKGQKSPEERKAYFQAWQEANRHKMKKYAKKAWLKRKYNMSVEDYDFLCIKQSHKCKICEDETTLVVDHCHTTGEIRGLLCNMCNFGLGHFLDDPNRLASAILYLEENKPPAK